MSKTENKETIWELTGHTSPPSAYSSMVKRSPNPRNAETLLDLIGKTPPPRKSSIEPLPPQVEEEVLGLKDEVSRLKDELQVFVSAALPFSFFLQRAHEANIGLCDANSLLEDVNTNLKYALRRVKSTHPSCYQFFF